MENTTAAANPENKAGAIDLDGIMDGITKVFGFFRKIVDFLAGLMQPIFTSLLEKLAEQI